jgi:hypothetical protein
MRLVQATAARHRDYVVSRRLEQLEMCERSVDVLATLQQRAEQFGDVKTRDAIGVARAHLEQLLAVLSTRRTDVSSSVVDLRVAQRVALRDRYDALRDRYDALHTTIECQCYALGVYDGEDDCGGDDGEDDCGGDDGSMG